MDTELAIFLVGAGLSYWPLFLAISRGERKRRKTRFGALVPQEATSNIQHEFLALLQREAVTRAEAALHAAMREASSAKSTDSKFELTEETRNRLDGAGQLIASLFAEDVQATYDHAVVMVGIPSTESIRQLSRKVHETISALDAAVIAFERKPELRSADRVTSVKLRFPMLAMSQLEQKGGRLSYERKPAAVETHHRGAHGTA